MKQNQKNLLKGYNLLLYFAGSMITYEPTEECVIDFWMNGTLEKLPVSSTNPKFIKAAALLRHSCPDKNICKKVLQEDYLRLFAETGLVLASVHASDYYNNDSQRAKIYDEISKFYNSYGWNSNSRVKRTDDHLGIELLFLTRLIDMYLLLDDVPSSIEMENEIRSFISQHILSWIPLWNEKIQEHARTLSYKGIGILVLACIEDLHTIFSYSDNPL